MARAVYQYELSDPDFTWLINSFQENHQGYCFLQTSSLPLTFIRVESLVVTESQPVQPHLNTTPPGTVTDAELLSYLKGQGK